MAERPRAAVVVIVPLVAWGPLAERCVAGCSALAGPDYLISLVASDPSVVPERWRADPRIEVIAADVGIARKRNLAIAAHPEAAIFACIDSDAWPEPDWLEQAGVVFASDPEIWLVGGPNLSPPELPRERAVVADALRSILVSGHKAYTKRLAASRDASDLPACNLLIRRAALDAIGGFDEAMEVGEDSVLCRAVLARGKRIRFSREVRVFHQPRRFGRPFLRQRIVSGYGIPPLLRRCGRTMGLPAVLLELLPTLALLFFALGGCSALLVPTLARWWAGALAAYGAVVLVETLRFGRGPASWPATAAALVTGNLAPGIGTLYRWARVGLAIGRYYRNDE